MEIHVLKATPDTVFWGYFNNKIEPVLTVKSGDFVRIETITHQSGDAPEIMMDDMIKEIYHSSLSRGPGDHIMTGPIKIEGAQPGDVLEVRVLELKPRLPYGSQVIANWGQLNEHFENEYVTIYRTDLETGWAIPEFKYKYPGKIENPGQIKESREVELQDWSTQPRIPLRFHLGVSGVAPKEDKKFDSTPPQSFGGNVDNRNFNAGTAMYYKVQVEGANYYAGDSHFAQGDGELSGTAIEGSINAVIRLILHKDFEMREKPILETEKYWMTHGMDESLDGALEEAALEAIHFLVHHKGMNREEAYSFLSASADFHVTQIANGVKGIHCRIRKDSFPPKKRNQGEVIK